MAELAFQPVFELIKKKQYKPIIFLHGEEPFFIDEIADYLEENLLSEAEKGFNQSILYGNDVDAGTVVSAAKRYPMMAQYQLVMVKEAQRLKDIDNLASYCEKPSASTILVICYKDKIDKRKKLFKTLQGNNAIVMYNAKMYDNKVPAWINSYVESKGFRIDAKAAAVMLDYLGADLSKIANEINKLIINLKPGAQITIEEIEKFIGISRDYNIFELQNALGTRNSFKAFQIVHYFAENPKASNFSMVMCISSLYGYYSKLWSYHCLQDKSNANVASKLGVSPYFVNDYVSAARAYSMPRVKKSIAVLLEYDLKSKGVEALGGNEGELLKEMVYKLLT